MKDYRINNSSATFTPPSGGPSSLLGDERGGRAHQTTFIVQGEGKEPLRTRKIAAAPLGKGDLIRLKTGGGGGHGDPLRPESARVLSDVVDGYITREQAKEDYGVVIDPNMEVDEKATGYLRGTLIAEKRQKKPEMLIRLASEERPDK